jgi:hypothetical protein
MQLVQTLFPPVEKVVPVQGLQLLPESPYPAKQVRQLPVVVLHVLHVLLHDVQISVPPVEKVFPVHRLQTLRPTYPYPAKQVMQKPFP